MPAARLTEDQLQAVIRTAVPEEQFLLGYVLGYADHAAVGVSQSMVDAVKPLISQNIFNAAGRARVKAAMVAHVAD